jgi:hypothetical protein
MTEKDIVYHVAAELGTKYGTGSTHLCDLSGEWADRRTAHDVMQEISEILALEIEANWPEETQEILDAYEEAYNAAAGPTAIETGEGQDGD